MQHSHASHVSHLIRDLTGFVSEPYSRDTTGLSEAVATDVIEVRPNEVFELRAKPVVKRVGKARVKMLAFNGSIPGPTLRVKQNSEITVHFTNEMDLETTVHWHGLRLDHRFDGVPHGEHHGMQAPVPPGGSFTYRLRFPDPGVFWYHPHIREDYAQEHGLYGNIIVEPVEADYWSPVNRELTLVLDDILIVRGKIAKFSQAKSSHTAMGRFGNVMLANGEAEWNLNVQQGEVIRFYLTNTANVRTFRFSIPGASMKLVGADNGRTEREQFVDSVLISPSERVVVDVLFQAPGIWPIEHRAPKKSYRMGNVVVSPVHTTTSFAEPFMTLRHNHEFEAYRSQLAGYLAEKPTKTLALVGDMGHGGHHHGHGGDMPEGIEWEDTMPLMNKVSSPHNMFWRMIDRETGKINHDIDWSFRVGDRVKIRIVNEPHSDHPMQHPIHFHGERFLVLSRNGEPTSNLMWKDTVLVTAGETVDIMLEASNPGHWMAHCHIAEHVEGGMMFNFDVH